MKLQKELQTNTSTSEMLDDRISHMKDHMKNVDQELKQNLVCCFIFVVKISVWQYFISNQPRLTRLSLLRLEL